MSLKIPFYPKHELWNSILNSQAHDDGQEWSSILYNQFIWVLYVYNLFCVSF
jgi:hypothetical protein